MHKRKTVSQRIHGFLLGFTLLTAWLSGSAGAFAQTQPQTAAGNQAPQTPPAVQNVIPSYEGQKVTTVELAGQPDINVDEYRPMLTLKPGEEFSQQKIDQSIVALKATGRFKGVRLELRPDSDGVRVMLVLQPAMYFGIYEFPGAVKQFTYSRLVQVADFPPRGAFSMVDVQRAQEALVAFFRRSGYFRAEVTPELKVDRKNGLVSVDFNTKLNKKAKFGNIDIEGPTPQETEHLRSVLKGFMARLRGAAIRPGKTYRLKTLSNASQRLESTLMSQDHLAAKVKLIGAEYHADSNRADIKFNVQIGPVVHVKVAGAHLWPWTRHSVLPVYAGLGVDPELIQEGRQNLVSYFQNKGYFDTKVSSTVQQQPSGESIVYQITKGPRHRVKGVEITGNQHITDKELMPHVSVKKARFFSHGDFSDKLVHASADNLTKVYRAYGYSDAKVIPTVANNNGNIVVTFRVNEGEQDIVQDLRFEGNTLTPQQFAPQGLKVAPGQAYSQENVDTDRAHIVARYLELGFLNANFHATARRIPGQKHRLDVVYEIQEGPQVHTGTVITLGRQHTKQRLVDREMQGLAQGKPLKESDMLTSESELYKPGVFDWAEIDPRRPITTQTDEDVVVKVHEGKRNSLVYGVGFEVTNRGGSIPSGTVAVPGLPPVGLPKEFKTSQRTFWGPRGTLEYTRSNLRGKAETASFTALAGRLVQRASILYTDPMFRWSNWSESISIQGEHNSENPIFTSLNGQFNYQLERPVSADKTQNVFLHYSFSQTGLTNLVIPDLIPAEDMHVRLSTFSASYTRDTRDNTLDAHKGNYDSAEIDLNPGILSSVSFSRFLGQAAYYKKIIKNIIWANSFRLGLEGAFGNSHVPVSEKFFSGGGSTLRGFSLNGAGPQRTIQLTGCTTAAGAVCATTVPVGGQQLVILNSELRIPVDQIKKGLGVVGFYDGGNVYQNVGFNGLLANYTNTVGIGLRYATPVGPVRIDFGHNLNAGPSIKANQVFITLGQAF